MRLFLLLSLLFTAALGFAQSKKQLKIEALERKRFEAMTTKNLDFLKEVVSDDLTYTHSNGLIEDKAAHLENIRTGKLQYRSILHEEMKLSLYRRSVVGTGIVSVSGMLEDREFSIRLRYTDVYIKRKGKWQLAAWQSLKL